MRPEDSRSTTEDGFQASDLDSWVELGYNQKTRLFVVFSTQVT